MSDDISVKGLDDFAEQFIKGQHARSDSAGTGDGDEYIRVTGGQKASDEALEKYYEERKVDFIKRAGSFTEDLVAFFIEQKKMRDLSDREAVFAIALMNINLRHAYGSPQGGEKDITPERRKELLDEFDAVCYGAQQYWDANQ